MLDRSSNRPERALKSLVQHVPLPVPASSEPDPCHVPGEDAPLWLAVGFAVLGALIAAASGSVWEQGRAAAIQTPPVGALPAELPPPPGPDQQPSSAAVQGQGPPIRSMPQPMPESANAVPSATDSGAPTLATVAAAPSAAAPPPDRKATASDCFHPLSIPFERGSARPAAKDVGKLLSSLQSWLSRHADAIVVVEGHADTSGTEDYNVLLSYSRAKTIAGLLKNGGIPARRITIRAAGSGEAVGSSATLASDRDAVLRIAGVEGCGNLEAATKVP